MKATLEFDLDNPEDRMAHLRCVKSLEMACALFEIVNNSHRYVRDIEHYKENINNAVGDLNIDELIQ